MTNDTIYITDTFTDIDAGAGDDVLILQAISLGTDTAIIRGGIGHDILDASGVFAGYSTMFFFNDEVPTDTPFDALGFSVGPFQVEGVEEIIGNASRDNYFSLFLLDHGVTLHGGSGADSFGASSTHEDIFYGNAGDDDFSVKKGDIAYGGLGNDSFNVSFWSGETIQTSISGGAGTDELFASFGSVTDLQAGTSNGPFSGANDTVYITEIENVIVSAHSGYVSQVFGDDKDNRFDIHPLFNDGSAGVYFDGRGGNDALRGSLGDDTLFGGTGNDSIYAGAGDDLIFGGTGQNQLFGGAGNDVFTIQDTTSSSSDTIFGGLGADRIILSGLPHHANSAVVIADFDAGLGGDIIDLNVLLASIPESEWDGNNNPFLTGLLEFQQIGSDTHLFVNLGGTAVIVMSLSDIKISDLVDENTLPAYVLPPNQVPSGTVEISGILNDNSVLTAVTSAIIDADGLGALSYQWLRDGVAINGATAGTYALGQADVGANISVRVDFVDLHGTAESLTSAATADVANVNDMPVGTVAISGDLVDGETLTAASNVTDADGIATSGFVWLRDGVVIAGAVVATYMLTQADVDAQISVSLVYQDSFGNFHSVTSAQTAVVADDVPVGTTGNDTLIGSTGNDTLSGGAGSDMISGGTGADVINGGSGSDDLSGGGGADVLNGGDGADDISGGGGADTVSGDGGSDTIYGNNGNDALYGGGRSDLIYGGGGKDALYGGNGNDKLYGGNGADKLYGEGKADQLYGGGKADQLYGGGGEDKLYGDGGFDKLFGGNGADKLDGGAGRDVLTGGAGADDFIFDDGDSSTANTKRDVVTDFGTGADDIDLRLMDADRGTNSDDAFVFSGTTAGAHCVWYQVEGSNVVVYGDQTGDGNADFEIVLLGVSSLRANDFLL